MSMNDDDLKKALGHLEDEIRTLRSRTDAIVASGDAQYRNAAEELHKLQVSLDLCIKEVKELPRVMEVVLRIKSALSGPEDGSADGFFSKVRRLREDLDSLVTRVNAGQPAHSFISRESKEWTDLQQTVKDLDKLRQQQIGAIAAASTIGSLLGFGLSFFFK